MTSVFPNSARDIFVDCYPETCVKLTHRLDQHELLTLGALAALSERLPASSVEYNAGDLPIGIASDDVPANGLSIGDTIRGIEQANSWAVLKNVEQDARYRALLGDLLEELEPAIRAATGAMLKPQAFVFVSSPGAVTPFHFDPEHNILLQLRGTKEMTVFPAGDERFAPAQAHERYHLGGSRNLPWDDGFLAHGVPHRLTPGDALHVPVMAPHFVRNGAKPSVSLSITWRSDWSYAEADARALNRLMRRAGLRPRPPERHPAGNRAKSIAWRALRRARLVG